MRTLVLATVLTATLGCNPTEAPELADTTQVVIPETPPDISARAARLVGRWANQNGTYVTFRANGTVAVSGRDARELSFRILGDSLVVSDSTILAVDIIPLPDRYLIETLTEDELVLAPASGALGGGYIRDSLPVDSTVAMKP